MTLHIKHVNFAKGFRGGERQTLNLIEGLATVGVPQILVCRPGSELQVRAERIGVATRPIGHPLSGHLQALRSNSVHVHEARGAYWAMIEQVLRGSPYLITRRIPNPVSNSVVNRFVFRRAAELVGVSRDVSARLAEQTGHTVSTILDSCTVHPVDMQRTAAIKAQLGGGSGPIIGHVGALYDHHKGQSILIAAFHQLLVHFPNARLVLLGEGPDKDEFIRLARKDSRIVFAGFQEDVGSWLAAMDLFAFPSREEGLGSSVLDAMLLGVPVVSAAVGGLPELIGNDERGLMVHSTVPSEWAAAMRRFLDDDVLRQNLRNAALSFAQANNVAAMTSQYLAIYHRILNARHSSPSIASI